MKKFYLVGVLALAVPLAGCNNTQLQQDVASALATGCPMLAAIEAANPPLSNFEKAAEATLANACPPNPPPSNLVTAVADIVAAYTALSPYIPKAQVATMNVKMQRIKIDIDRLQRAK